MIIPVGIVSALGIIKTIVEVGIDVAPKVKRVVGMIQAANSEGRALSDDELAEVRAMRAGAEQRWSEFLRKAREEGAV